MTFPATPLPMGVELYIDGAWTDITPYVYSRDAIDIRRGKSSEGGLADPSSMTLTLNNRDGRWSPRNPSGTYYGKIGRNTKVRAWVENGTPRQPLGPGYYFSTPDSAALSITGDIDIRADAWMLSWRPIAPTFVGPFKTGSYGIYVTSAGYLVMYWSADGTNYDTLASSEPIPGPTTGRRAVRATLDVNNGAGGKTARFYYSDDNTIGGTWIEFGSADTTAGTTSIFNSADALLSTFSLRGECYDLEIRNGIGGSIVAKPAFTTRTAGASSFADSYGNIWTGQGGCTVSNRHYRFYGEVAEWPQKWDRSGRDVYVPVECSGILRRLGQGNSPVVSALFHGTKAIGSALRAYWPFEDSDGSTTMMAGVDGGRVAVIRGAPSLAAYSDFVCSDAIPTVGTGRFYCPVTPYTNTDEFQVRFLLRLATTIANNTVLARIYTNNTLGWIDVVYQTTSGGQLYLQPYTNLGVAATASGVLDTTVATGSGGGLNSIPLRLDVEASKNGAGVDFLIAELEPEQGTGYYNAGNVASATLGACTQVIINPNGADLGDTAIGHVTVEDTITTIFDLGDELSAYRGEEAVLRAYRILNENSVTSWLAGYGGESEPMGYEKQASFLALVRECEAADGGVLYEPRQEYGLAYRSLESLFGQAAVVALDYSDENLQQFEPVDDDRNTRNKVTVTRVDGSSATVEDTTSSMSTQDPPNGVGLYDTSLSLSLSADSQAVQRAGWAVHAGTVDEARWPTISINLAHPDFVADADLTRKVLTADVGDRLMVGNPPPWLPPDDVDQIIIGTNETISQFEHSITFVCEPAATYRSATLDATAAEDVRWGADSSLNGAHSSSTTSLSVALDDGVLWSHADGDFDIVVGGERMTVTAVSGSSSPQTFTVTRSVNGVVTSHSDGDAVVLFKPTHYVP